MSREAAREARGRRNTRQAKGLKQLPWRNYQNNYDPIRVLSEDQLEAIHQASLRILKELGIGSVHPRCVAVQRLHDQASGARSSRPLA